MLEFQTVEQAGVLIVTCPTQIDASFTPLDPIVKSWLLSAANLHVLDFKETLQIRSNAYRAFVIYNQQLKANKKLLYCINVNADLLSQFRTDGLLSVFIVAASVEDAKRKAAPSGKATVDVEFINPFIAAVKNVLEVQASLPLTPGKIFLKTPQNKLPVDIAGCMTLAAPQFNGSLTLCFRAEVFFKIYKNLTGETWDVITPEIEDAAAELLNIVFGQAKTVLNDQKGYKFVSTLPTVLTGERLNIHHHSPNPAIILPFESPAGAFHLEILVDRR